MKATSKKYNAMNTVKKSIVYNSMGERVASSKSLGPTIVGNVADVNVYGSFEKLRRTWRKQLSRVDTVEATKRFPKTLLKGIPSKLLDVIYRNIEFPQVWSPHDDNFFDLRRAVRISRTLLDMRYAAQQEFVDFVKQDPCSAIAPVADMTSLLVLYFERNFGASSLNVAHQKVFCFIQRCCVSFLVQRC